MQGVQFPSLVRALRSHMLRGHIHIYLYACLVIFDPLQPHGLQPTRFLCPWDFPGKDTGVGCHFLLQGICLTQGSNSSLLHFLHWQVDSLPLSNLESPFSSAFSTHCELANCECDFHFLGLLYGEGNGTPLQYFCLETPMDGGAWQAAVHGMARVGRLSDFTFTFHFHALEKEMATHSSVLAWRIPGTGGLVGCRPWGRTESDTTEAMQQQQGCCNELPQTRWLKNHSNLLSHNSGSEKSKIKVSSGPHSLWKLWKKIHSLPLLASSGGYPAILSLQSHHSSLLLCLHITAPSVCLSPLGVYYKETCHWSQGSPR